MCVRISLYVFLVNNILVNCRFCGPYGVMLFLKKGYSALFHHAQYRNPPGDPRTQPLGLKLEDTHSDPGIHELGLELLHRWSGAVGRGLQSEDAVVFFARSCGSVRNKQPLHTGDHAPVAPTPVGRLFPPGQGGYRPRPGTRTWNLRSSSMFLITHSLSQSFLSNQHALARTQLL